MAQVFPDFCCHCARVPDCRTFETHCAVPPVLSSDLQSVITARLVQMAQQLSVLLFGVCPSEHDLSRRCHGRAPPSQQPDTFKPLLCPTSSYTIRNWLEFTAPDVNLNGHRPWFSAKFLEQPGHPSHQELISAKKRTI